jgi:hypothetical protein
MEHLNIGLVGWRTVGDDCHYHFLSQRQCTTRCTVIDRRGIRISKKSVYNKSNVTAIFESIETYQRRNELCKKREKKLAWMPF